METNPLGKLQREFSKKVSSGCYQRDKFNKLGIVDQSPISVHKRLFIYQNAYILRTRRALREHFPSLLQILEEEEFDKLVKQYLRKYPSRSWTLAQMGEKLPRFLSKSEWNSQFPYLTDMAKLDWYRYLAQLGPKPTQTDFSFLESLNPEQISGVVLGLAPSAFIIKSKWNIHQIQTPINAKSKVTRLMIHKRLGKAHVVKLSKIQWKLLRGMKERKTIAALLESISTEQWPKGQGETQVFQYFFDWAAEGCLSTHGF